MTRIKYLILLIRPKHWLKNLLVFASVVFAFQFELHSFFEVFWTFVAFSLFASSVYIINDILDIERDRAHPKKKHRPIAAGKVKIWQAFILFVAMLIIGTLVAININTAVFWVCLLYLGINLPYSFGLKHLAIIDVMIIALGFVLRVIAGAYAINVPVSHWLLLCTFFISLFLAFGKRKNEMDILSEVESKKHRKSISEYTDGFINQMLAITAGISIVFYSFYTIDPTTIQRFGSDNLIYTTPIVVFAVLRYFHLLYNKKDGGDPVAVFSEDKQIMIAIILWLVSVIIIFQIK